MTKYKRAFPKQLANLHLLSNNMGLQLLINFKICVIALSFSQSNNRNYFERNPITRFTLVFIYCQNYASFAFPTLLLFSIYFSIALSSILSLKMTITNCQPTIKRNAGLKQSNTDLLKERGGMGCLGGVSIPCRYRHLRLLVITVSKNSP